MRIPPQKIMSAIDFSTYTDNILSYSLALCKKYHAKLILVHVPVDVNKLLEYSESALDVQALHRSNIRDAQQHLEELTKDLAIQSEIIVRQGAPAEEINRLALEREADMVVTATHGRSGFQRLLIGSVTEKLLKTLHCPMLILHTQENDLKAPTGFEFKLNKILVGCDFSPDAKLAFDYALSLAQEFQAELHLSHVLKPSFYKPGLQESKALRGRLEKQLEIMVPEDCRNGCIVHINLLDGEPYVELMNYAKERDIDMIVLGIRGHTLLEKLLVGSTTDRLIRHAPFPVLAVR